MNNTMERCKWCAKTMVEDGPFMRCDHCDNTLVCKKGCGRCELAAKVFGEISESIEAGE